MTIVDCPHEGPKVYLGPVRCPYYSEHERCRVARGTGPDLFARHYCAVLRERCERRGCQ